MGLTFACEMFGWRAKRKNCKQHLRNSRKLACEKLDATSLEPVKNESGKVKGED
jgi:hypothetical protein